MTDDGPDPFTNMFEAPAKLARALFAPLTEATTGTALKPEDMQHWAEVGTKLQGMWARIPDRAAGRSAGLRRLFRSGALDAHGR